MTLNGKTYVALHNNDHMGPTNTQFTIYWKELVPFSLPRLPPPLPFPIPPTSKVTPAPKSDIENTIRGVPTLAQAGGNVVSTAKSTYSSFGSVISSAIARVGLVLVVGASIVIGVIVVWAVWNSFIGKPAGSGPPALAPMIGAPAARW
jgi:hypothetical protein